MKVFPAAWFDTRQTQFLGKTQCHWLRGCRYTLQVWRGVPLPSSKRRSRGVGRVDHAAVRGQPQVSFGRIGPPASSYSDPMHPRFSVGCNSAPFRQSLFSAAFPLLVVLCFCPAGFGRPIRAQIQSMCLIRKATGFGAKARRTSSAPHCGAPSSIIDQARGTPQNFN